MTLDLFLTILIWIAWSLPIVLPLGLFLFVGSCLWSTRRKEMKFLLSQSCPHCDSKIERSWALDAISGKHDPPRQDCSSEDDGYFGYRVSEHFVLCESCGEFSYWYPETAEFSASRSSVLGIPESTRPLPESLQRDSGKHKEQ